MLLMGKSTISTGPFSMSQTVNVYQRVSNHGSLKNCAKDRPTTSFSVTGMMGIGFGEPSP